MGVEKPPDKGRRISGIDSLIFNVCSVKSGPNSKTELRLQNMKALEDEICTKKKATQGAKMWRFEGDLEHAGSIMCWFYPDFPGFEPSNALQKPI